MKIYSIDTYAENYEDLIICSVLVVVATIALILRLWARRTRKIKLWVDDYALVADLACLYCLFGIQIADVRYGMRVHVTEIPAENLTQLLKMEASRPGSSGARLTVEAWAQILVAYQFLYGTSILLRKISYLFFYKRIFVSKSFLVATWVILGLSVAWFVANVLQIFLICRPFASNWDVTIIGVCGNRPVAFTAIGATHMVIDVGIMLLPVHFISKLQMKTSAKLGICFIFLIGLSICAISIVRMVILSKLSYDDISFNMLDSVFWTVIEPALVIVNACLPTLKPLLQDFWNMAWNKAATMTGSSGTRIQLDQDEYPLSSAIERRFIPTDQHVSYFKAGERDIESQADER